MPRCFMIQPFDGGQRYDKRYEDVFEPAIRDAGLEPYRVDRDPSVSVPIENIERDIKTSAVCLAEISTDNPNVWFESRRYPSRRAALNRSEGSATGRAR